MYQLGSKVLYGSHGICEVVNVETKRINNKSIEYLVLQPVDHQDSKFYLPTQNESVISKLRPMMSSAEIESLLNSVNGQPIQWIEEESQRKIIYKELISSGDREALIRMIYALHRHRRMQMEAGKKFHLCDETFLRDAERILDTEFALALHIPKSEVGSYIESKL